MVSGEVPVADDRKNKWRHAWMAVPVLVIAVVFASVVYGAVNDDEPLYDPAQAVFHEGHLYANFRSVPVDGSTDRYMFGVPVPYDTLWGPLTRAVEFVADDGKTYGDCVGVYYLGKPTSNPWLNQPHDELACRELS